MKNHYKRAVVTEELFELTGNDLSAMLLKQMLYWLVRRADIDQFLLENPDLDAELSHGWVYKTAEEWKSELMTSSSPKTILRRIDDLLDAGWVERRNNPNFGWDKTYQYRPCLFVIEHDLNQLGYSLASVMGEDFKVIESMFDPSNGHGDPSERHGVPSEGHGDPAIPEITTESTPENTSISLSLSDGYVDVDVEDPQEKDLAQEEDWEKDPCKQEWQHTDILDMALDACGRTFFQSKEEADAWRDIDDKMVSVIVNSNAEYITEWVEMAIDWAERKNIESRPVIKVKFPALLSLINNSDKQAEFVRNLLSS